MEQPTPRVALGQALRGIATSAIDVSDGLLGDLGHVLRQSGVGASIHAEVAATLMAAAGRLDADRQLEHVLAGGDDYELAFTAPAAQREAVQAAAKKSHTAVTRIGQIESASRHAVARWPGPDHAETLRLASITSLRHDPHAGTSLRRACYWPCARRQQPRTSPAW